ncbi:MAG: rRNA maturation RNase YbeY [Desulfobacterales bacterium]
MRTTARALLNALGSPDAELSVVIMDDEQIAQLNEQFRHRNGPTNVLAFAMNEGEFAGITPDLLGDVVISADTAAREADELGISLSRRLDFLLTHGILHLFGYDHERSEADEAEMDRKTEELYEMITHIQTTEKEE